MEKAHLTHVERIGKKEWEASCQCEWKQIEEMRAEAIKAAEFHWLSQPVITGRPGPDA